MEMHDDVRFSDRMPNGRDSCNFQTKDLECRLDEYEVPPRSEWFTPPSKRKPNSLSAWGLNVKAGLAGMLAVIALSGCTLNGYRQSYTPTSPGQDLRVNRAAPAPEQPAVSVVPSGKIKETSEALVRRGFAPLGYSSFNSPDSVPDSMAIKQAKRLGADLVMIMTPEYAGSYTTTDKVSEPVGTTTSRTTIVDHKGRATGETAITESTIYATRYVSRTVDLTSNGAMYWVRLKTGMGFVSKDLTMNRRRHVKRTLAYR